VAGRANRLRPLADERLDRARDPGDRPEQHVREIDGMASGSLVTP
jgi:hypothetical protein